MKTILKWISDAFSRNLVFLNLRKSAPDSSRSYERMDKNDEELTEVVVESSSHSTDMLDAEKNDASIPVSSQSGGNAISLLQITKNLSAVIFAKENAPRIATASALTAFSMLMNFLAPYLFGETVASLADKEESRTIGGIEFSRQALIIAMVIAYTLSQILPNIRDQVMVPVSTNNTKKILKQSIEHLLKNSYQRQTKTPFSKQVYFVQKGFIATSIGAPLLTQVAPTVVEIGLACGMLSSRYGIEVGLGLLGILASHTGYAALTANSVIKAREADLNAGNEAWQDFCDAIEKYKIMYDFGKYDDSMKQTELVLTQWVKANNNATLKPLQIDMGHTIIIRISMLIAALYIGLNISSGKYTVQDFMLLMGYMSELSNLLPRFGQGATQLFASSTDVKFVFSKLAEPDEVVDLHPDVPLVIAKDTPPSIEFENVSFSYPSENGEAREPLFENLSFEIEQGQDVAFVGASGSGKTTIFDLLFGYAKPDSGRIKINGQDISQVSLVSRRKNITYFRQTPDLFNRTIRENIVYGAENSKSVTDEMIWDIAKKTNLENFLKSFADGLDTEVGEHGNQLSGGQRQKVAILRGFLKNSPIELLDEVTSALDSRSVLDVLMGFDQLSANKTRLMITHKLTEVRTKKIFVIKDKKIFAHGSHDELLESCEHYQELWEAYKNEEDSEGASQDNGKQKKAVKVR
jgi:ABC-type multidrug transport system fused ATPase/permease subunit